MNFIRRLFHVARIEALWSSVKGCGSVQELERVRSYLETNDTGQVGTRGQQSSWGYFPGLEAKPWHDPAGLSHTDIEQLLLNYEVIRNELECIKSLRAAQPIWATDSVVGSGRWNVFYLHLMGRVSPVGRQLCPQATAITANVSSCVGRVFFSALDPNSHIKPHHDATNTRLRLHLGLEIPPGSTIRVSDEWRNWRPKELLFFDGSFEHEVWNRGLETRWVLIMDVWHPGLTLPERHALNRLSYLRRKERRLRRTERRADRKIYERIKYGALLNKSKP